MIHSSSLGTASLYPHGGNPLIPCLGDWCPTPPTRANKTKTTNHGDPVSAQPHNSNPMRSRPIRPKAATNKTSAHRHQLLGSRAFMYVFGICIPSGYGHCMDLPCKPLDLELV